RSPDLASERQRRRSSATSPAPILLGARQGRIFPRRQIAIQVADRIAPDLPKIYFAHRCYGSAANSNTLYSRCYTLVHEIPSVTGKPPQGALGAYWRGRVDRPAAGPRDRLQAGPYFQLPQPQARSECRGDGQGIECAAPVRPRSP